MPPPGWRHLPCDDCLTAIGDGDVLHNHLLTPARSHLLEREHPLLKRPHHARDRACQPAGLLVQPLGFCMLSWWGEILSRLSMCLFMRAVIFIVERCAAAS